MSSINDNYLSLEQRYLFVEVASRVAAFCQKNPSAEIIRMGIGDVTQPIAPAVAQAMHKAVEDCCHSETFHGYGPEPGYDFLREAIVANDYAGLGIKASEIFVSDGAKSDTGNIGDIFSADNVIGITDPVYPVYVDTNTMAGRRIVFIPCNRENGFTGDIPEERLDIVYLCYPNNPTGAVITKEKLKAWVDYALRNNSIIFYDAAYEAFIRDPKIPHSIYEIEGAKRCAIEFRSFSKTAGFTGIRCAFTVVPEELTALSADGREISLNQLWDRRQSCKFNGASYISQRGAEAVYSPEGKIQVKAVIDGYLQTASLIRESLGKAGLNPIGGENSPYIWAQTPGGMPSWDFFDLLLNKTGVVITPGAGFGQGGEGYFRVTAFNTKARSLEAMEKLTELVKSL